MRQGITTRFLGPSNVKGSRYKATARPGKGFSLTMPADHALNYEDNHAKAAQALAAKLGWDGLWVCGGSPDERGYIFVHSGSSYLPFNGSKIKLEHVGRELFGREGVDWFIVEKAH